MLSLEAGDTVIFSSRVIPGNELAIGRLHNALLRRGVEVLTHRRRCDPRLGPSGARTNWNTCTRWSGRRWRCRCTASSATCSTHAELARALQRAGDDRRRKRRRSSGWRRGRRCIVGTVSRRPAVARGQPRGAGRMATLVRDRRKAIYNGSVTVTVVLERSRHAVREVLLSCVGVVEQGEEHIVQTVQETVRGAVENCRPLDMTTTQPLPRRRGSRSGGRPGRQSTSGR